MGVSFFRETAPEDFATFDRSFYSMCAIARRGCGEGIERRGAEEAVGGFQGCLAVGSGDRSDLWNRRAVVVWSDVWEKDKGEGNTLLISGSSELGGRKGKMAAKDPHTRQPIFAYPVHDSLQH
jgi:hypothetical protein